MPRLTDIAKEVGNAISTRERVVPLFRRLKELESYMDPSFGESKGNDNSSYSRFCTIKVKNPGFRPYLYGSKIFIFS